MEYEAEDKFGQETIRIDDKKSEMFFVKLNCVTVFEKLLAMI